MKFFNWLFGCSHKQTTFPITPARRAGFSNSNKGTYIVCLDCGKEFGYDWANMRITKNQKPLSVKSQQAGAIQ